MLVQEQEEVLAGVPEEEQEGVDSEVREGLSEAQEEEQVGVLGQVVEEAHNPLFRIHITCDVPRNPQISILNLNFKINIINIIKQSLLSWFVPKAIQGDLLRKRFTSHPSLSVLLDVCQIFRRLYYAYLICALRKNESMSASNNLRDLVAQTIL